MDVEPFHISLISVPGFGSLSLTEDADIALAGLADHLLEENEHKKRFKRSEFRKLVRSGFGFALSNAGFESSKTDIHDDILRDIRQHIQTYTSTKQLVEYSFACSFITGDSITPFELGPALFESRSGWLSRKKTESERDVQTLQAIEDAIEKETLQTPSGKEFDLWGRPLFEVLKESTAICSVRIRGLGYEAGTERALFVARLAMTSLSLLWTQPSRIHSGLRLKYDGIPHVRQVVNWTEGGGFGVASSTSHSPGGPSVRPGKWETTRASCANYCESVAELLDYAAAPLVKGETHQLKDALIQALHWFHSGCREAYSPFAIVKFVASLDSMALGKQDKGILKLIERRLGIAANGKLTTDGTTAKKLVKDLYQHGRSRIVHGTNTKQWEDQQREVLLCESLASRLLIECIMHLHSHPDAVAFS